jgi:hypothetical protein
MSEQDDPHDEQAPSIKPTAPGERPRCVWEVTAGIVPGAVDHEHTRRFGLTAIEWDNGRGLEQFYEQAARAAAYAQFLQVICAHGRSVNWTRVEFVWF